MLINFCDGRVLPHVSCDKVCTDSNPVENLISVQNSERMRGFIAENFVRPPVNITVQLPCNIEIYRIVIDPVVGAQKSCGYEIFSCSDKVDTSPLLRNEKADKWCKSSFFVPIGKKIFSEPGSLCFTNNNFRAARESLDVLPSTNAFKYNETLRHGRASALNFVSHVVIRITKTISGSAVCLKTLEVWGRPSKSSPANVECKLKDLFSSNKTQTEETNSVTKEENYSTPPHTDSLCDNTLDIPEDFIDCITQEIMTIPMLLPCGKNIDQSTLDKHVSSEGSWGRMPNDPFTGLTFDSLRKPVPNTALKGRIDQFVLLHSAVFKSIPRTVGQKNAERNHTSKLVSDSMDKNSFISEHFADKSPRNKSLLSSMTRGIFGSTRNPIMPRTNMVSDQIRDINRDSHARKRKIGEIAESSSSSGNAKSTRLKGHESDLSSSLNSALASALGTLPSFIKPKKSEDSQTRCISCKNGVDDAVHYKLLCEHNICRSCLTSVDTSFACTLCDIKTLRKDVVRVHIC